MGIGFEPFLNAATRMPARTLGFTLQWCCFTMAVSLFICWVICMLYSTTKSSIIQVTLFVS